MKKLMSMLIVLAVALIPAMAPAQSAAEIPGIRGAETEEGLLREDLLSLFLKIGGTETGTAGASLKQAETACAVMEFCAGHGLEREDAQSLQALCLETLEKLEPEQLEAYQMIFPAVAGLIDACLADWDHNRAVFEDAGLADAMEKLLPDRQAGASWQALRDSLAAEHDRRDEGNEK